MSTLGHRLAIVELDAIGAELVAHGEQVEQLAERLEAVRSVLAGDVLDLRDQATDRASS